MKLRDFSARFLVSLVVVAMAGAAFALPASAFPEGFSDSSDQDCTEEATYGTSTLNWKFDNSPSDFPGFSSAESTAIKVDVQDGIEEWDAVRNYNGTPIVDWVYNPVPIFPEMKVRFIDDDGDFFGKSDCDSGEIVIDVRKIKTTNNLGYTAVGRHEAGHYLGLRHTDGEASYSATYEPTMATCLPGSRIHLREFDNDGRAGLAHDDSKTSYGAQFIMSNHGFETAGKDDYTANTPANFDLFTSSSLAQKGSKYARISQAGTDPETWLRQTVHFWGGLAGSAGDDIDGRLYYRTTGTFQSDEVELELYVRGVDHPGLPAGSDCVTQAKWPFNDDGRSRTSSTTAWDKVRRENAGPESTWTFLDDNAFNVRSGTGGFNVPFILNRDTHDLRIKITNKSDDGFLYIDTMALRDFDD